MNSTIQAQAIIERALEESRSGEAPHAPFLETALRAWITLRDNEPARFDGYLAELPPGYRARVLTRLQAAPTAPSGSAPAIVTAADLLSRKLEPIQWIVPGLLPEGLMLLAARPKVGKSWLALQLAIAVATGGEFFGRRLRPGRVLYLALEDNERRLVSRLGKLGASGAGLERLHLVTTWPRGLEGANAITEWIAANPDARLVVVDVLTKLRENRAGRDSGYAQDFEDVTVLKPPPGRSVGVLAVHHTRKATADDPLDEVSGTLGVAGAADGAWVLKRARGSDEAELHLIGRDVEEEGAFAVRFNRDACAWTWLGDAWRVQLTAERRALLEALADGPRRPVEIARALGRQEGAVRKLLSTMVQAGQVDRGLDGRYRPIDGGDHAPRAHA